MSISPNVPSPEESYHYENLGTPRWILVLFGLLIAGHAGTAPHYANNRDHACHCAEGNNGNK